MCLDCRKAEGQDTVGVCTVVLGLYKTVQIPVDSVYPVINSGRLIMIQKLIFILHQVCHVQSVKQGVVEPA